MDIDFRQRTPYQRYKLMAQTMHRCGDALPHERSEPVHARLTPLPSPSGAAPRIAQAAEAEIRATPIDEM